MYSQGIGQEAQTCIQRKFNVLIEVFVGPESKHLWDQG
jgi:hypothetical protein